MEKRVANAIAALDKLRIVGFNDDIPSFAARFESIYGSALNVGVENTIRDVQDNKDLLKRVYDVFDGSMKQVLVDMSADDLALYDAAMARWG